MLNSTSTATLSVKKLLCSQSKYIFAAFSVLLLLGFPDLSHAGGTTVWDPDGNIEQIIETSPAPEVDGELAHLWFQLMFGEFIWTPWGEGCTTDRCATVLSKALGFTNVLALLMGLIVAYYVMLGGAINTAHSGEVLGKSWSSVWLPIRSAVGFGMIMPASGVGGGVLSTIQVFVIWLVILGSNAGSVVWTAVADEFASGTPVVKSNTSNGMKPALDLFESLMCTKAALEAIYTSDDGNVVIATIQNFNGAGDEISARAEDTLPTSLFTSLASTETQSIHFGENGDCGSITFKDTEQDQGNSSFNDTYAAGMDAYKDEVTKLGGDLINIVNDIYRSDNEGSAEAILIGIQDKDSATLGDLDDWGGAFYDAALDFDMNLREEIVDAMADPALVDEWKREMTAGGWAQAGVWYFEISRFQGLVQQMVTDSISGISPPSGGGVCGAISVFFGTCDDSNVAGMSQVAKFIANTGIKLAAQTTRNDSNETGYAYADEQLFVTKSEAQNPLKLASDPESASDGLTTEMAMAILNQLSTGRNAFGGDGLYGERCVSNEGTGFEDNNDGCGYGTSNPFYTVSSIGHTLTNVGLGAWAIAGTLYTAAGSAGELGGIVGKAVDLIGAKGAAANALTFAAFSLTPVVLACLTQGFMLAFVVPFLPLLTWTFMIAGYLLSVVEAVVAAPLAVIMMVTPEGEGISGTRMERAMSLIAMVILKPSLMVIGLVASMTLGNILFAVLNQFFWAGAAQLTSWGLLELMFTMTIYVTAAFKLCQYTVSIMHKLPDQILEWFTSGAARSFGENDIGPVAGQVGSAGNQQVNAMGQGFTKAFQYSKQAQNSKEASNFFRGAKDE